MKRWLTGTFVLVVACRGDAPTEPSPRPAPKAAAVADDEGIVITIDGAPNATWEAVGIPGRVTADDAGRAILVLDAPPGPMLTVREQGTTSKIDVALPTALLPPVFVMTASPRELPTSYSIDAKCSGECTGTATFDEGSALVRFSGTRGCTVSSGLRHWTFDPAARDPDGKLLRHAQEASIDIGSIVQAGRLPDVLTSEVDVPLELACKGAPVRTLHAKFAAEAARSAVWSYYQFAGASVPGFGTEGHDRSSAISFFDSDGAAVARGIDHAHDLVHFVGAPKPVTGVDLVAKIVIGMRIARAKCTGASGDFEVEIHDWNVTFFEGQKRSVAKASVRAPAVDCAVAEAMKPVHVSYGEGYDVRVWQPNGAALDAVLTKHLRP